VSRDVPHTPPVWLSCDGKERYETAQLAEKVCRRRNASKRQMRKSDRRPLEAYRCQHCGFFHLGTMVLKR
jgi:hypothetical protein